VPGLQINNLPHSVFPEYSVTSLDFVSKPEMNEQITHVFKLNISTARAAYNALLGVVVLAHSANRMDERRHALATPSTTYSKVTLPILAT
jgi:hypothetical protein